MSWYLTWQDPVALALCALGLGFAWWLRRRATGEACGCDTACATETPSGLVPTEKLRLGRGA